jgi:hypothetical protein
MREKRSSKPTAADKINALPDDVLCRILSLFTTKEAVATSILSKRWTHLWRYLNNIDFTDIKIDSIESNSRFNDSVYSVFVSRDSAATAGSHFINSFSLDIEYGNPHFAYHLSYPNVVKWVNLVVQRRLKHLLLHLHVDYSDIDDGIVPILPTAKLPIAIFTCKTLVSLDLRHFSVKGFSFSSIGFGFPSLKTLSLNDVDFSEDPDFVLFLYGCSILEDIKLYDIYLTCDEEDSLTIELFKSLSFPNLIRADITQSMCRYFPLKALSTSNFLCLDTFSLYTQVYQVRFIMNTMHVTSIYVAQTTDTSCLY